MSPPRRIKEEVDSDLSPPRPSSSGAMAKTLGGKKAGLQDAKAMKEEMLKLKKKEKQTFEKVTIYSDIYRHLKIVFSFVHLIVLSE